MGLSLLTNSNNELGRTCPVQESPARHWMSDLPRQLKDLVITPVRFDVHHEHEIAAERTIGRDVFGKICFCDSKYVLTDLQSDDGDTLYEDPAYAESTTSWRMVDSRWLVCRTTKDRTRCKGYQTRIFVCESMPN